MSFTTTDPEETILRQSATATLYRLDYEQERRGSQVAWKVEWMDLKDKEWSSEICHSKAVAVPFYEQQVAQ
jgi:hypothetical protein